MDTAMDEWWDIAATEAAAINRWIGYQLMGEQEIAELAVLRRGGVKTYSIDYALNVWLSCEDDYGRPWSYVRSVALRHAATSWLAIRTNELEAIA